MSTLSTLDFGKVLNNVIAHPQTALANAANRFANTQAAGGGVEQSLHNALSPQTILPSSFNIPPLPAAGQGQPSSSAGQAGQSASDQYGNKPITLASSNKSGAGRFTPTYFNGVQYTDPQALANAQIAFGQHQAQGQQFQQTLGGQTYTDPHAYYQALLKTAMDTHTQNVNQINKAYQQGLISFDQRNAGIDQSRQAINQSHTDALNKLAASFQAASPFAYQSQQQTQTDRLNHDYTQANQNLDTNAANSATDRQNFIDANASQTAGENQSFQGIQDNLANGERAQGQSAQGSADALQGYIDSIKNNLANYQATASKAVAANNQSVLPTDLAFAEAPNYFRDLAVSPQAAQAGLANNLAQQNVPASSQLNSYLYGLFSQPGFQQAAKVQLPANVTSAQAFPGAS